MPFISEDQQAAYAKAVAQAKALKKLGLDAPKVLPPSASLMTAKKWKAAITSGPAAIQAAIQSSTPATISTNFVGTPADSVALIDPTNTKAGIVEAKSGLDVNAQQTTLLDQANALVAQLQMPGADALPLAAELEPETAGNGIDTKWLILGGAAIALVLILKR